MQRFTGREYLKIDIANNFGLDKKTWTERLTWFDLNQDKLDELLPQADEPALYHAGVQAWHQVQQGQPIGYPISLDATSSGLQILAALTGDRKAAQICNVVNHPSGDKRADAYTIVYEEMLRGFGGDAKIKREDTKKAIMTSLYGSKAQPKRVFGEGEMLTLFLEIMQQLAPAAWELNEAFLTIWDPEALSNDWVLPDNFNVRVKVMAQVAESVNFLNEPFDITRSINAPIKDGRSLGANTIHSIDGMIVREMVRRCSYDPAWIQLLQDLLANEGTHFIKGDAKDEALRLVPILWQHYQESGYLSARILDHLDGDTIKLVDAKVIQELLESLPAKPFQIITVHDCFRCLPQYGNDLRMQYNRQLYEVARSELLSFLLSQLVKRKVKIGKLDPTLASSILDADYSLS